MGLGMFDGRTLVPEGLEAGVKGFIARRHVYHDLQ